MKVVQVAALLAALAEMAHGFSFSELTSPSTPSTVTDNEERIYGGSDTKVDKYPYMEGIRANGPKDLTYCGGTLVAPQYVVTAAHCLEWFLFDVYVSLGVQKSVDRGSRKSEQIKVVEAFRHPLYKESQVYDVAMLKLAKPSKHRPVRLCAADGSDNKPGTVATVLGWGLVNNETLGQTLQSVDVEIIPDKKCNRLYKDTEYGAVADGVRMCAGVGNGKDSCSGDSGAPLIADDVLVGVVAAGPNPCGEYPGLYGRVDFLQDYIKYILNGGSSENVTVVLTAGGNATNVSDAVQLEGEAVSGKSKGSNNKIKATCLCPGCLYYGSYGDRVWRFDLDLMQFRSLSDGVA